MSVWLIAALKLILNRSVPGGTVGVRIDVYKRQVGICLPAGPWVTDDHVRYIVDKIKAAIEL